MSLICCRSVPKKVRLGIYRTQIRPKTRLFFFSVTVISQALESDTYLHFSGGQYSSLTPHLPFYLILLFGVLFSESWKSKLRKKFGKSGSILKPKCFSAVRKVHASARHCSRFQFWREIVFFPLSYR